VRERLNQGCIVLAAAAVLSGCAAVGPDYVKPAGAMPPAFVHGAALTAGTAELLRVEGLFWQQFQDPALDALIHKALSANTDVRMATARLREARGQRSEVQGRGLPTVDAAASARRNRASLSQAPGLSSEQRTASSFDAGFDASWELDLFGGVRRSVQAATAQTEAVQADLAGVRLSVAAEVARRYLSLRGQQQRLQVAIANLQNQSDTLRLTQTRLNAGRGTEFDLARIRSLVEATRATLPALQAGIASDALSLALLTGQPPGAHQTLVETPAVVPAPPALSYTADPAALLRRRPDVRAAERRLEVASASIGITTAQLFPSVSLTGFVGLNAGRASDLSGAGALAYSVGPGLRWNLLDFGRTRARIEQADARAEGALAAYEGTVLQALHDAETALVNLNELQRQGQALLAAAEAARTAARLARIRYDAGATDLLAVLDAQRQVLGAEDQLAQSATATASAVVAVFKAFGGGWSEQGEATAQR
jgi:outer membrane protein, multidrug efflux system